MKVSRLSFLKPGRRGASLPHSSSNSKAGFTLIEILISVVIVAVGILGVTAMQTSSLSSSVLTRNLDSCSFLASDILDRISSNWNDISSYGGGSYADFVIDPSAGCTAGTSDTDQLCKAMVDMQFDNALLTVSFDTDSPISGLDTVTATITWSHKGGPKQCQAMTIIPRT